ncbi:bestrophin family protein [Paraflavitalea pollutisoli]|uniref:bestrophin family protein n=1 Tax=Paraflavitalea pollutisoli TaxID=3034143 RepID=UPI0023ED8BFF|nr:bestrophin family ion channel [Paraflavitalea sp. H1-2-19X]
MLLNKRISILDFVNTIKTDLIIITIYAIVIGMADEASILTKINVPIPITSALGTAVVLLLAFRTNQSYERWWEARLIWGAIVNDSRTLIRQVQSFSSKAAPDNLVKDMAERQIVWCYALGESLRRLPFTDKVSAYLQAKQVDSDNIPNALLSAHSQQIAEAYQNDHINSFQQIQLDTTVSRLTDAMGKCERIKNTVFPKSYSLLIHFIIYVFATLLPFGLSDENLAVEIGLTIVIPVVFVAIERTSILMQDPFENKPLDTPMTALSETIEMNIRKMTGDKRPFEKTPSQTYYQL